MDILITLITIRASHKDWSWLPGSKYCSAAQDLFFFTLADITNDLNVELSRVVCELESALERKPLPLEAINKVFIETINTSRSTMNENTLQVITAKPVSNYANFRHFEHLFQMCCKLYFTQVKDYI